MMFKLAMLGMLVVSTAATAAEVGDAGRQTCADWLKATDAEQARMTSWVEGYAAAKYGPAYPAEDVRSFLRSYCEQWPNATLFETIDMAYRTGAKSWDPNGGPRP